MLWIGPEQSPRVNDFAGRDEVILAAEEFDGKAETKFIFHRRPPPPRPCGDPRLSALLPRRVTQSGFQAVSGSKNFVPHPLNIGVSQILLPQ
jgi:hypothetical protein